MSVNAQLLGITSAHITETLEVPLHKEAVHAFADLKKQAQERGFALTLASGFRGFDRQMAIWNGKAGGERPILDSSGAVLPHENLTDKEKVFAILRWSALPGASRHHWGSDADVFDRTALKEGQVVQLTHAESAEGGVFYEMHRWLDSWLPHSDFYRPYAQDRGGVSPEPWHLSYLPLAQKFISVLTPELVYSQVEGSELLLKREVLANFDEIYTRFIQP